MSDFEAYLRSLKEGCTPSRTVDAMFYSLLGGGKRVRPAAVVCRAARIRPA